MNGYERVRASTLAWLDKHEVAFSELLPAAPTEAPTSYKPLCELVLAADILAIHGTGEVAERGRTLLRRAWDALQGGAALETLLVERPDLPVFLMAYPSFQRIGLANPTLETAIARHFSVRGYAALEQPGWFRFGIARLLSSIGASAAWDPARELAGSWLGHMPEPWSLTRTSAYAVTHAVFYATDNGATPEGLDARYRTYLEAWLPPWIRRYQRAEDADLAAELVMVARCIGALDVDDYGELLAGFLQPDGSLPGPADVRARIDGRSAHAAFLGNYHTTLVGLSAAVMSLRP